MSWPVFDVKCAVLSGTFWGPPAFPYLRRGVIDGSKRAVGLDDVLLGLVLLQPLQVPEAGLLQDLQPRAQNVLLLLQVLQALNLRGERAPLRITCKTNKTKQTFSTFCT